MKIILISVKIGLNFSYKFQIILEKDHYHEIQNVRHECTTNISFLVLKHFVFRPTFSFKPEFTRLKWKFLLLLKNVQVYIYTLNAIALRNLTCKAHEGCHPLPPPHTHTPRRHAPDWYGELYHENHLYCHLALHTKTEHQRTNINEWIKKAQTLQLRPTDITLDG